MLKNYSLHLVTDSEMLSPLSLDKAVEAATDCGVTVVQLREKNISSRHFVALAKGLKKLLRPKKIPLFINDRIDVAMACEADGVHLGQTDISYQDARKILGPRFQIGVTIENKKQFYELKDLDIDYFGLSTIYPTDSKKEATRLWSTDDIKEICQASDKPLIGIGGINQKNAPAVLELGLGGIAVISAICQSNTTEEIKIKTNALKDALRGHHDFA